MSMKDFEKLKKEKKQKQQHHQEKNEQQQPKPNFNNDAMNVDTNQEK